MSRFVCLFLLSLSLVSSVQLVHSAPLEPLVCLDEEDALNLLNQARPVDALMNYMYGALTDDEFSALIQRTKLVRIINDLCSSPNSVAIFVGTSSSTGAPIYVHGCEAGMTCSDTTPDHSLFVGT